MRLIRYRLYCFIKKLINSFSIYGIHQSAPIYAFQITFARFQVFPETDIMIYFIIVFY